MVETTTGFISMGKVCYTCLSICTLGRILDSCSRGDEILQGSLPLSILTRYIFKEVLKTSFAVTAVLLLMVASSRFAYYLSRAVAGELDAQAVLTIIANLIPAYVSYLLPLGGFVGLIIALGRMSVDNELTVLSANGISASRLMKMVAVPVLVVTAMVATLSLAIAPYTSKIVEEVLYIQSHTSEFEHIVAGKFQGNSGQQTIYAEAISDDKSKLMDVFVYNHASGKRPVLIRAESATQYFDETYQAKYLLLSNGTRTQMQVGQQDIAVTRFQQMGLRLYDEDVEVDITHSFTIPTLTLFESPSATYRSQIYWRFSLPIMTIIVAIIGMALSQVNPRQGRFARLLPAIVLFLAYYSLLMRLRDQIGKGVAGAELNVWLLHLVFLALGIWLVYGKSWWRSYRYRGAVS